MRWQYWTCSSWRKKVSFYRFWQGILWEISHFWYLGFRLCGTRLLKETLGVLTLLHGTPSRVQRALFIHHYTGQTLHHHKQALRSLLLYLWPYRFAFAGTQMSYRDSLLLWKVASQYTAHGTLKGMWGKPRTDYVLSEESFSVPSSVTVKLVSF